MKHHMLNIPVRLLLFYQPARPTVQAADALTLMQRRPPTLTVHNVRVVLLRCSAWRGVARRSVRSSSCSHLTSS